jgi:hypothetical protein
MILQEVVVPIAGMVTGLLITLSVIKAGSRMLERRHEARMAAAGGHQHGEEVEQLRSDMGQLRSQVDALEERLDFTERLLTQERNRRQIEPGHRES